MGEEFLEALRECLFDKSENNLIKFYNICREACSDYEYKRTIINLGFYIERQYSSKYKIDIPYKFSCEVDDYCLYTVSISKIIDNYYLEVTHLYN